MRNLALVPVLLALAACNSSATDPIADPAPAATPDATATPSPTATLASPVPAPADTGTDIPSALQGRWGLVSADCVPGRDDAKGLLVIRADSLEYYESMGKLGKVKERSAERLRASFGFTGEGMTWQRDMELTATKGGAGLTASEFGEGASPAPLEYTRCA